MGKTAEEILKGLATTVLGVDEQGVSALLEAEGSYRDDALSFLKDADAKRIAKIKSDSKAEAEPLLRERYSLGKKEALEKLEQGLRDKFGSKSDKQGLELIEEIVQAKQPKGEALSEDAIKKHPLYLNLEQQYTASKTEFDKTLETRLKEQAAGFDRERTISKVRSEASAFLDTLNPVLPKDPVKANNLRSIYLDRIASFNYQVEDDNGKASFLLLDKEGKRLEDPHGHPMKVHEKWKEEALSMFETHASEERHAAPMNGSPKGNDALVVRKPASQQEYSEMLEKASVIKDPKVRADTTKKLRELWQAG